MANTIEAAIMVEMIRQLTGFAKLRFADATITPPPESSTNQQHPYTTRDDVVQCPRMNRLML